jgi:hypothetical protein
LAHITKSKSVIFSWGHPLEGFVYSLLWFRRKFPSEFNFEDERRELTERQTAFEDLSVDREETDSAESSEWENENS